MTGRPLDGITVVSLEQAVAAPYATRQLADLGARVIKVERPSTGDFARDYDETVHGQSSYFVWLNRSKESVTLDLKSEAGRTILEELLVDADVFVQNLGPGATTRLGLGADALAERLPRLVVCDVSGFGATGPWSDRKAYDLLVQAESGLMSITGTAADMVKAGISIADIAAGMYAFSGILTSLLQRERTGRAAPVEVSLFEALAEWMGAPGYYTEYGGRAPSRTGGRHATIAPYGPFPTASGDQLVVAVQNDREWTRFCAEILGDPELAADERFARNTARVANRAELDGLITARLAALDTHDAARMLDAAGIANARVRTMPEFLHHPVLDGRERWQEVATVGGTVRALLPPATIRDAPPRMDPVPALGEHSAAVLRALGRTDIEIDRLRADHVI